MYREPALLWEEALAVSPDSARVMNNLGLIYGQRGDDDRAQELFESAIRMGGVPTRANYNLGNLYHRQGSFAKAIPFYQEAMKLDFDDSVLFNSAAVLHLRENNFAGALPLLIRALELNPRNNDAHRNLAGLYEHGTPPSGKALAQYELALQLSPSDAHIQNKVNTLRRTASK